MCLPNEDITELLEFCYKYPQTLIPEGTCLFLIQRQFVIDSYNCTTFVDGCPKSVYRSSEIYKNPSCVSIGKGCFLAEPFCNV